MVIVAPRTGLWPRIAGQVCSGFGGTLLHTVRRCTNPLIALLICATSLAFGATFREITDTGPWGDYEAFPDVCRMANGDLYVVFYAGLGHVTNPSAERPKGGAIYGLRSSDQGATWSEPILVVDTGEDDRDPHVTQLSNGDLIVSYFTSRYYTEDDKRKRDAGARGYSVL